MTALELRVMPLADLKPAPDHPRRALAPASGAYRKLKASLVAFGLVEPLVWNELTGHVVGGAARLRILAELGYTEVPVSVVRLSELREKALCVALDNPKAQGRYAPAKLAALLARLDGAPELELTGFDRTTLGTLRLEPAPAPVIEEKPADRVEVTLVTDAVGFTTLAPHLDKLIGEHELVAHVRRGA
jgi:ParB-like chromosome segregation protein Spo0J